MGRNDVPTLPYEHDGTGKKTHRRKETRLQLLGIDFCSTVRLELVPSISITSHVLRDMRSISICFLHIRFGTKTEMVKQK